MGRLVLTVRVGDSVMIGDEIVVTIMETSRGKARVGIDAPRDIPVYRESVYREIHKNARVKGEE